MAIIETYQLSKTYRSGFFNKTSVAALADVTLEVQAGEIFGLLGPNGAGKTTFVKILLSIVHPSNGSAHLLGKTLGEVQSRAKCGYLAENHRYPSFLTALETLLFFGELNGEYKKGLKDKSHQLLEFVGLKEWSDRKIQKFSKGMLQRLGLAQALLNDPEVLFLDEPTDGVDPIGRKEMRDLFLKLKKDGVSIFLNSHLLSEVEMISDRVAILNKGELIKVGTLDEVRGGTIVHQIRIDGTLSEQQIQAIGLTPSSVRADQTNTILSVTTDADLNRAIDLLRSWGIMIKAISQQKSSLEDSFIKLVSETNPT
jgi:ABC-2 type transport system ATP-binding protein